MTSTSVLAQVFFKRTPVVNEKVPVFLFFFFLGGGGAILHLFNNSTTFKRGHPVGLCCYNYLIKKKKNIIRHLSYEIAWLNLCCTNISHAKIETTSTTTVRK